MAVKLTVFDMAGTTVGDSGDVIIAFRNSFQENGIAINTAELQAVRGLKKTESIKIILEKLQIDPVDSLVEKIHRDFIRSITAYYRTSPEVAPAAGAEEIFSWLKEQEIRVTLNTGFSKEVADSIVNRFQWKKRRLIDDYVSSDEVDEGRPSPLMIRHLMNKMAITDASEVAKIGDTSVDVQEGRNAACGLVVGITTGALSRSQLEQFQPDYIIDHLTELRTLIN